MADMNTDVVRLMSGNEKALERLFRRYSREMYYFAMGLVNDRLVAEDAVQEGFVYIWTHRSRLDPTREIGGYLRECVKNYILNYFRHQKVRNCKEKEIIREQLFLNESSPDLTEQLEVIRRIIDSLPENCRKIFVMAVIEGHGYAKVAEEMNLSVNTVKSQVRIAYRKIRSSIDDSSVGKHLPLLMILLWESYR